LGVAAYSLAAYATRAQAIVGLLPLTASFTVYTLFNHDAMSGRAQDQWAVGFFAIFTFGWWVVGFAVHAWRLARANAALAREHESRAAAAVASERARIARELHDVVSHRLSAVVVQAEGAQARAEAGGGGPSTETLAKIERSGREAMVEMRRMLDVLRADDDIVPIAPTPEFADVPTLIEAFRRDGLDVSYACDPPDLTIASGVGVTIHRLVHEALTNVLRHGGTASARVTLAASQGQVLVRVADDGDTAHQGFVEGHGLMGMRERVALSGGTLTAGPHPEGGFVVEARLPLHEVDP
jgi:signal transduction histidine kinase